jgi:CheY-like chemotaxis protein
MKNHDTYQPLVLVVDDNVWMQRIVAKILTSYGIKSAFADNGYDAVASAIDLQPDAIILDIIMPDLNGIQVLKMLKNITLTSNIPVIVITVASDADNLGNSIKYGAAGFIRKPFTRATIHDKLSDVLSLDLPDIPTTELDVSETERDSSAPTSAAVHFKIADEEHKNTMKRSRAAKHSSRNITTQLQPLTKIYDERKSSLTRDSSTHEQPESEVIHSIIKRATGA